VVVAEDVESGAQVVTTRAEAFLALVEEAGEITSEQDDLSQKEMQAQVKAALKEWEEERRSLTDPLNAVCTKIKARYDAAAEPAKQALELLNGRIKKRYLLVQEAARKEQARQDRLAAQRRERAEARAEATGVEVEPIIPLPTVAAPAKTTKTSAGRVTVSEYWTWRYEASPESAVRALVDAGRLDMLVVNEKAVGAVVRAGIRQLPGVVIYQDVKV
jgi:hypothetical protein